MGALLKVFCSYSHKDEDALDQLRRHLAGLRRQGLIADWHDRQIPPGGDWDATIKANLEDADLILLLVSADFIQSNYCMDLETARALERDKDGTATVIPIFWRECVVESLPFTYLQGTPKDMRWIDQQANRDKAWAEVVATIATAARSRQHPLSVMTPPFATGGPGGISLPQRKSPSIPLLQRGKPLLFIFLVILIGITAWYGWKRQASSVDETLLQQGEYGQAQAECEKIPPSSTRDRCQRITGLMLEPRDVDQFEAAASHEDSAYAETVLGEAAASREDFTTAEQHYQEALHRNPAIAQAYFGMGQIRQAQNKPEEAFDWYQQAVERAPQNRRFILNLAAIYAERGDLEQAEVNYRKVLALDNSVLLAYVELIDVLLRQHKTVEAAELAQSAKQGLAENPDWKGRSLNQQEWIIMQDGQSFYLQNWEQKQDYMNRWFNLANHSL